MNELELQPAYELWRRYRPEHARYAFQATTRPVAEEWQAQARPALAETLGFQDFSAPLEVEHLETVDRGDHTRQKIMVRTGQDSVMPVYLLIPKGAEGPLPTVLASHGHGNGVKDVVGLWEDGTERDTPDGVHQDFAVALCRRGFAVAAPEIAGMGERETDFSGLKPTQEAPTSCMHAAMLASHLGGSLLGLRVRDARRLIDHLATRPEFDLGRLGTMGLSGGGMLSFFTSCLDVRITACVVSGYYSTFKDSIHAMKHCACNYVHGLHDYGELYDLVALVAPRPLFIEAGTHDDLFPIEAVTDSVARAREVYHVFGTEGRFHTGIFEGRHRIDGPKAYAFLQATL